MHGSFLANLHDMLVVKLEKGKLGGRGGRKLARVIIIIRPLPASPSLLKKGIKGVGCMRW